MLVEKINSINEFSRSQQCRLCGKFDSDTISIFNYCVNISQCSEINDEDDNPIPFVQLINECFNINVNESTNLPGHSCKQCFNQVLSWFNFKTNCLKQQLKFKEGVDSSLKKQKESEELVLCDGSRENLNENNVCVIKEKEDIPPDLFYGNLKSLKRHNKSKESLPRKRKQNEDDLNGSTEKVQLKKTSVISKSKDEPKTQGKKKKDSGDFQCDKCSKLFHTKLSIRKHLETHEDYKKYCCHVCGTLFKTSACLQYHVQLHTTVKKFQCPHCPKRFHQTNHLKQHIRIHTGEKPYKCDDCDQKFTRSCQLNQHVLAVHRKEKKYRCKICDKEFLYNHNFKAHMMRHNGQKDAMCELCHKTFVTKNALFRHQRLHTGDKPFPCHECGKRFADCSNRKKHILVHHSDSSKSTKLRKSIRTDTLLSKDFYKTTGSNVVTDYTGDNEKTGNVTFVKSFLNSSVVLLTTVSDKTDEDSKGEKEEERDIDYDMNVKYPLETDSLQSKDSGIFIKLDNVLVLGQTEERSELDLNVQDDRGNCIAEQELFKSSDTYCQSDSIDHQCTEDEEQVVLSVASEFTEEDIPMLEGESQGIAAYLAQDREDLFRPRNPSPDSALGFGQMDMDQSYLDLVENQQRTAADILSTIAPCETQSIIKMLNSQGTILLFPEQYDLSQINETETST